MPGTIGGVDIWKTTINPDGSYTTPENLGASINTEGNESFPFIADDNQTLYFASSGAPRTWRIGCLSNKFVKNRSATKPRKTNKY